MVLYEIFSDYWRESRPRVCWRSRSKSKVTWYGHFCDVT